MSATAIPEAASPADPSKRLNAFERYLTVWIGLCVAAGVILGRSFPGLVERLCGLECKRPADHVGVGCECKESQPTDP